MATIRLTLLALLAAVVTAACGGGAGTTSTSTAARASAAGSRTPRAAGGAAAFAWLHPAPAPSAWSLAHLPGHDTAVLAYPSSWHRIHSDPGTVSAVRMEPASDLIADYLNATPQQGEETLQNWARFRPAHNVEEGDSHVQLLASARGLRFRDGHGSCVIDRYNTPETTYQEIACLVRGPHGANVIVAAARAARWAQEAPALERAVSAFLA
jgi:hypothetical protein